MVFRSRIRFRGYWLSLLSWLMLSFAIPMSQTLADDDGYMRLCSAMGAQWVLQDTAPSDMSDQGCLCLGTALIGDSNASSPAAYQGVILSVQPQTVLLTNAYALYQPRSPPWF